MLYQLSYFRKICLLKLVYSKRDLNPHSRNGQRILSPSCLPFHHPGSLPCAEGAGGKAQQSYANF